MGVAALAMPIFLDSSDLTEITKFHGMGIIRGVTTNPTLMLKEGIRSAEEIEQRARAIAALIAPLPVSVEVTTPDPHAMLAQAKEIASWAPNINVKITVHGADGELENMEVIHRLERSLNVRVNVTAMMSAQQCFLAALAGASYVSLFGGRVNNMGYNAVGEIARLRGLLDSHQQPARIIVGSTREVLNVIEWLEAGAHIVTVIPDLLSGMLVHPYSKETVRMFLRDAATLEEARPARLPVAG